MILAVPMDGVPLYPKLGLQRVKAHTADVQRLDAISLRMSTKPTRGMAAVFKHGVIAGSNASKV
jgi:hypothetical protein